MVCEGNASKMSATRIKSLIKENLDGHEQTARLLIH